MSVELALWMFPALWLPTSPGIAGACSLHAVGFDAAAVRSCVFRPMETES